jgi:hypothetical protein
MTKDIIDKLLRSDEPSVRFKILVNILGERPQSVKIRKLQQEIKSSPRVKLLLSLRDKDGRMPFNPYKKWIGAHWMLADLADIGYPPGDESLIPLREQVYQWLFSKEHEKKIKTINGRTRRCASQESNALHYLFTLGLADDRTNELARRLVGWQWPDGGWNCDKNPKAVNSSYHESWIPLRALALHAKLTGNIESKKSAKRASEVFLKRRLYKKQKDGSVISKDFVKLHYPYYWRYGILCGLKVLAEAGFVNDKRCEDTLDLLESKRLPDGGFPAEVKYYQVSSKAKSRQSLVDWGGVSKKQLNEFITADALYVLKEAGRLK